MRGGAGIDQAIDRIGRSIQWQRGHVAGDRTFCIYLADGEDVIHVHAELSGIPVTSVTEIPQIIDPTTASN